MTEEQIENRDKLLILLTKEIALLKTEINQKLDIIMKEIEEQKK